MTTFLDALVTAITAAASYNPLDQTAPIAVLWPDGRREWAPLAPLLRERLPLLTLGPYQPAEQTGPAVWLRCEVARLSATRGDSEPPLVLYLPGVAARAFANHATATEIDRLRDLDARGCRWAQPDGRDWTVADFWQDTGAGLGVALAPGQTARAALLRALPRLASRPIDHLRAEAPWKASDFDALLRERRQHELDAADLIAAGESLTVEFKATLRRPVGKPPNEQAKAAMQKVLESEVVGTIAAFLNAKAGGTLLIGVNDDGGVRGLADDFETLQPKDRHLDAYERLVLTLIRDRIGLQFLTSCHITFPVVEGVAICRVDVGAASEAAYCKDGGDFDFYVRVGNLSQKYPLPQAVAYIRSRWG